MIRNRHHPSPVVAMFSPLTNPDSTDLSSSIHILALSLSRGAERVFWFRSDPGPTLQECDASDFFVKLSCPAEAFDDSRSVKKRRPPEPSLWGLIYRKEGGD
ncbi:hypothetical protein L2E82_40706 [Cichorium intybus]|uniref:Uncharacterized protein n=1 Tax=Cichorium intybus TaxID=13427 RepID=A0ACB9AMP9_CICIN|nr:hypothetical protein L2E82_40706 [Cichorium intybus]